MKLFADILVQMQRNKPESQASQSTHEQSPVRLILFLVYAMNFFVSHAWAEPELYFPAEKNGVTLYPQKIDYQLSEKGVLKMGPLQFSLSEYSTNLIPSKKNLGKFSLAFRFTPNHFPEGELQLLGPDGKQLISQKKKNTKNGIASFDQLTVEKLSELAQYAYLKLCFSRQNESTLLRACGIPFFVSKTKSGISIQLYQSSGEVTLLANGTKVDPIGTLVLNNLEDTITLQAISSNAAQLYIETKGRAIDYYDVVAAENSEQILLRIKGAKVIDEFKVNSAGQYQLPRQAQLHLLTEGGISVTQELSVTGNLPREADRLMLKSNYDSKVIGSSLKLKGQIPGSATLTPENEADQVEQEDGNFVWHIQGIDSTELQTRRLFIDRGGVRQVVKFDVFRERAYEIEILAGINTETSLEGIVKLSRKWGPQWGASIGYRKFLSTRSKGEGWDAILASGFWENAENRIGIGVRSVTVNSESTLVPSISYWHAFEVPLYFRGLGKSFYVEIEYPFSSTSSTLTLLDGAFASMFLHKELSETSVLRYGVSHSNLAFKNVPTDTRAPEGWISYLFKF